jgi:hypothetical protein
MMASSRSSDLVALSSLNDESLPFVLTLWKIGKKPSPAFRKSRFTKLAIANFKSTQQARVSLLKRWAG